MSRVLSSGMESAVEADLVRPIVLVQLLFDDVYDDETPPNLIHTQLYLWNCLKFRQTFDRGNFYCI